MFAGQAMLDYKTCSACMPHKRYWSPLLTQLGLYAMCRDKFQHGVSTPMFPGDSVQMHFKDSSDPTTGKWYTGQVVDQGKFDYKAPATLWDSVTILWEDESKSILAKSA